ncbi:flavodoxin [Arthrobacter oryzae]|nr:flavodoxin [Arthrobacter oryzae]
MKALVVYDSAYGNTKQVDEAVSGSSSTVTRRRR